MVRKINIRNKYFNNNLPVMIVAEAGVNHNGRLVLARQLIRTAKEIGADAIKFQTWRTEELIVRGTGTAKYQKKNTGESDQYKMLKRLELSFESFRKLKKYADELGITFFSTPDEEVSLNFLIDDLNLPIIKIGSSELTNYFYLRKISAKHRPMILSTGMGTMEEVEKAVRVIVGVNPNADLAILHCTTNYPCPPGEVNLNVLKTYRKQFPSFTVGYSDHTRGIDVPALAVAMGAKIIEKHFTLDNNLEGPDHKASLDPEDFRLMVNKIREVERDKKEAEQILNSEGVKIILGSSRKMPTASEQKIKAVIQKKIVAKEDISKGGVITENNIAAKRTSKSGLTPDKYENLLGKRTIFNIRKDGVINVSDVK